MVRRRLSQSKLYMKKVWLQIEKRTKHYVEQHNKGRKKVVFEPEDCV